MYFKMILVVIMSGKPLAISEYAEASLPGDLEASQIMSQLEASQTMSVLALNSSHILMAIWKPARPLLFVSKPPRVLDLAFRIEGFEGSFEHVEAFQISSSRFLQLIGAVVKLLYLQHSKPHHAGM